jgi:Bacterial PH domain
MNHDDFAFEPIRGLPAELPPGETLLWQGSPRWQSLAVRAFHVRKVAVYFMALVFFRIGFGLLNGHTASAILSSCAILLAMSAVAIAVLSLLAYLSGRSTVYSITSRRVLLRHGIAVPMTMNIPFTLIESAAVTAYSDGTGEIALKLLAEQRVGYLITWPHLRPAHMTQPQPSFRALIDAKQAAEILGSALVIDVNSAPATPATVSRLPRRSAAAA